MHQNLTKSLFFFALGATLTFFAAAYVETAETRAGKRFRALEGIAGIVRTADPSSIDSQDEGHIVRVTGLATTDEVLEDPLFGVQERALLLERKVETFQWSEQIRDGERQYLRQWSKDLIDASLFSEPEGHENPAEHRFPQKRVLAEEVTLGEFLVPQKFIPNLPNREPVAVASLDGLPSQLRSGAMLADGYAFFGNDPLQPEVGDTRVSFEVAAPVGIHLLGRQRGRTVEYFGGRSGPGFLAMRLESAPLFPNIDRLSPIEIWTSRVMAVIAIAAGLLLISLALPAGRRPSLFAILLFALAVSAVIGGSTWRDSSPLYASLGFAFALFSLALSFAVHRRAVRSQTRESVTDPPHL